MAMEKSNNTRLYAVHVQPLRQMPPPTISTNMHSRLVGQERSFVLVVQSLCPVLQYRPNFELILEIENSFEF